MTATAARVLGKQELVEHLLNRPALALDDQKPKDMLTTAAGNQAVKDLVTRIDHGVHT